MTKMNVNLKKKLILAILSTIFIVIQSCISVEDKCVIKCGTRSK